MRPRTQLIISQKEEPMHAPTSKGTRPAWLVLLIVFALTLAAQAMSIIPVDEVEGPTCVVRDSVTGMSLPLSPEISQYNVLITDGFAHIRLTQLYVNRFENVNDIVYVFPLPHEGSVHAMSMEYDGTVYKAEIYEKQQAQHLYDSAKADGANAALLVQHKPNVFQQRLANIAYNDSAYVRIEVSMPLKYNNGELELAIPTMVAPRYGGAQGMPQPGVDSTDLWNPPADVNGQELFITTLIQTGYPMTNVYSPTHPLVVRKMEDAHSVLVKQGLLGPDSRTEMPNNVAVYLKDEVTYPNKDYVLRFERAAATQDFSLASYFDTELNEGCFALQLYPDEKFPEADRQPLELIFLIDISGSQSGWPIVKEKEIANNILNRLNTGDRISLCAFNTSVRWAFGTHAIVDATPENVALAESFVDGLSAGGGTELLNAVRNILAVPKGGEHQRYFIILTDGQIGNEEAIFAEIEAHPSNPTIFTFGAGGNLNRYFLDRSAEIGNGFSTIITSDADVDDKVGQAWEKIQFPQIANVTVDFGGLPTGDLVLPVSTNLYKGCPIEVYGRYTTGGTYTVTVRGDYKGAPVEITRSVALASEENTNAMIPKIWAKQVIDRLTMEEWTTGSNKDKIIEISTAYQVLSKYTAFLAINPQPIEEAGDLMGATPTLALEENLWRQLSIRTDMYGLSVIMPDGLLMEKFELYDLRGRLLYRMSFAAMLCAKLFRWDGIMQTGMRLRPGRYVVRLHFAGKTVAKVISWQQ
ncbi:MAG: VWA domain-containing protein [Chitinivibrionales bacterium]|nr:VWA domain-containing protein [Chitinivibrionales bacterium]